MPSSSPFHSTRRIVRDGFRPSRTICRATSMSSAAFAPLSSVPPPRSHESRCAPISTISSGWLVPGISATTFSALAVVEASASIQTVSVSDVPCRSSRIARIAASRSITTMGARLAAPTATLCRYSSPDARELT